MRISSRSSCWGPLAGLAPYEIFILGGGRAECISGSDIPLEEVVMTILPARILAFWFVICFMLCAQAAIAQPTGRFKVADTSSPRDTLSDRGLRA